MMYVERIVCAAFIIALFNMGWIFKKFNIHW